MQPLVRANRRLSFAFIVGVFIILTTPLPAITVHPGHYDMNLEYGTSGKFESSGYVLGVRANGDRFHQGGVQVLDEHHVITSYHGTRDDGDVPFASYEIGFGDNLVDSLDGVLTVVEVPSSRCRIQRQGLCDPEGGGRASTSTRSPSSMAKSLSAIESIQPGMATRLKLATPRLRCSGTNSGTCNIVGYFGSSRTPSYYAYTPFARPTSTQYELLGGLGLTGNSGDGAYVEDGENLELSGLLVQRLGDEFSYGSATAFALFDETDREWIASVLNPDPVIDVYSSTEDSDNDGYVNLLETAFGSDPGSFIVSGSASGRVPAGRERRSGSDRDALPEGYRRFRVWCALRLHADLLHR